jgi:endonuclease/exonuclease/phosphatase family metal-dependent hydrolase
LDDFLSSFTHDPRSGYPVRCLPEPEVTMRNSLDPLRVMAWNLCRGGRGASDDGNPERLAEAVAALAPDVLCCTETAGAAEQIVAACNRAGAGGYRNYRLSDPTDDDNLSVVTRLPVAEEYVRPAGRTVDAYNLGGLRLRLPNGTEVSVFDTWLRFDVGVVEALEGTAAELAEGRPRTFSDADLARLELPQLANIEEILAEHVPGAVPDDAAPVILAGGFNTESHLDWAAADPPGRQGITVDWQVTRRLSKAGYQDTYRVAHPDPERRPGSTCNPLDPHQRLPHRIDYVFARGSGIEVVDACAVDERLPAHGPGPFYSDHAAVVVDLRIAARS